MIERINSEILAAQIRTTHAVRAIGVFFIWTSIFNLLGGSIVTISIVQSLNSYAGISSGVGGITFGLIVIFLGYLVALFTANLELQKSSRRAVASRFDVSESGKTESEEVSLNGNQIKCSSCSAINSMHRVTCRLCDASLEQ